MYAVTRRLLVGAKNSATLCDLYVFVDQLTETVTSNDLDIVLDRVGKGSQRSGLAQGAMWAMLIEVSLIGSQHFSAPVKSNLPVSRLSQLCDDHTMLRSLEIGAVLSEIDQAHRDRLFWKPKIALSLDCFVCERVGRTTFLEWGAERAVCMSGRNEQHFTAARIAAFDVTSQDDRLMLRSVVDFWWAPFKDAKRGGPSKPVSDWVRLHYGCYCPNQEHQETPDDGSIQTNVRRPSKLRCGECKAEIAVDAEVPSIRLLT
ncbi:hypothetical protein [Nonomuraea sediminis]|uniref:hypothetical protein n=1 Tax=Nonomuraea sediminis TaxID=2835864 RepID=UPI001BDD8A96|nr:hypothetical protein [Nonomuraea sediminis]